MADAEPTPGGHRPSPLPPLLAALALGAFALFQALGTNNLPDLFIYRLGPLITLEGRSPYNIPLVRERVAAQFPDPDPKPESLVNNCGFFPPPLTVVVLLPFATLPWIGAKVLWALVMGGAAWAVTQLPRLFRAPGQGPPPPSLLGALVPLALVLNPLALAVVVVGQTPLLAVACVTAGQMCFDRGRGWAWAGALLWAVPFVKPHLALPLLVLAWYLGGWKRAVAVGGAVAALNLIGATMVGGSPLALLDYLDYLPSAHQAVLYNRAELNPQITSWNRLLFAAGGPLVELTVVTTIAGYLVWFGLVMGRVALAGEGPSAAWALAATAAGAVTCCQVLGYEVFALALAVPLVRDLFAGGWKARGWLAVLLLTCQLVPFELFERVGVGSHRPLAALGMALLVLIGPVRPRPGEPGA